MSPSIYLCGQLTVLRNIAYFRAYYGAHVQMTVDGVVKLVQPAMWLLIDRNWCGHS